MAYVCLLLSVSCMSDTVAPQHYATFQLPILSTIYVHYFSFSLWMAAIFQKMPGQSANLCCTRASHCSVSHPAMSNRPQFVTKYWIFCYFHYNSQYNNCISLSRSLCYFIRHQQLFSCSSHLMQWFLFFILSVGFYFVFFWSSDQFLSLCNIWK